MSPIFPAAQCNSGVAVLKDSRASSVCNFTISVRKEKESGAGSTPEFLNFGAATDLDATPTKGAGIEGGAGVVEISDFEICEEGFAESVTLS
jgi:hypothetical protein